MGKKSTKRRTRWRTLSITDSGDEAAAVSPANNRRSSEVAAAVSHNTGEVTSKDDTNRYPNTSYLKRKPLYDSSANIRSGYSRSYYKQQNGSFSSRAPYYRRPFQNGASRFFNYRTGAQNNYRSGDGNKEYNQARPIINEEEYTRITTPRQDVIFKKGYLSQPRKYLSSTDTNTTSSAAASVVSTEESISAASVPSLSPEQCSSYAESIDPEQAFMYSYFDQNGVFYFNPYLPNGFDQYAGQMFMLPYSYQPYNVYPSDVNSPPQSTDIEENPTSTDSNENLSDNKETHTQGTTPESPIDCDEKTDPPTSEKTTETPENGEKSSEDVAPHTEQNEATTNQMENFYNYGYQQFYPQMFFPYMYGQQFMPMIENDHELYTEYCNEVDERGETFKNRKKMRPQDGSSTGVTTTDCSEEDYSDKENISDNLEIVHTDKNTTDTAPDNSESTEEIKKIIFNADVKEFIPRQPKPHLNVNVKEFLPKNYKPKRSTTTSMEGNENNVTVEEVNEDLPKPQRKPIKKDKGSIKVAEKTLNSMEDTPNTSISVTNAATVEPALPNLPTKPIQETPKLTLAERIKRDVAKNSTDTEQSSPPKNNTLNLVSKKSLKKNEIIKTPIVKEVRGMTFAKMLSKDKQKPVKSQVKSSSGVNISNKPEKLPAKEVVKELQKQPEPIKVQSDLTAGKEEIVQDEWQTVKPKGKRSRHFVKEVAMFEELPNEKEALDQKVPDEIVHKEEIVKTSCEVPEVIVNEKCQDKIEKDVIIKADEPKDDSDEKSPNSSIIKNSDVQSSQKKNKLRNKKTKKNLSPLKKTKEKDILRILNEEKEEKTDQLVEDIVPQKDDSLLGTPSTKKEENILDNLYLMDRNNSLLSKRFCRNPLEILNGFDCKFKANKSILKEEEDMVLNVIKSLSTNQTKIVEIKSPKSAEQAEELNEKTAPTTINEEQVETGCSIKKIVEESEVPNEIQDGTENPISNRISNDYEFSEDAEEDTIIQEVPQEMRNSISDKLSDTDSLSDLSVEDLEKKGDIKDCLFQADENVCLKITYLDRQNKQNELEIKNVSQDEDEKKQKAAFEDHQDALNCQSSHNSLEGNNMFLANVPKELTDGHHNESFDLLSHNSLEERILLEDTIPANTLIVKTNETPNEKNLFLETPVNGESNGIAFQDDLVLESTIYVGTNKSKIDEDLLPEIETITKGESNGTVADNNLVLETIFNGEVGKTTVDESLVLETAIEGTTNKNTKETNKPEMKKPTVDKVEEISLKTTKIENNVDEFLPQETAIEKTHSIIDSKNEDPFYDIESLKPFKYNSEHTVDIKAVFEQKIKENDEEFKNKYNTIHQNCEDVKTPLEEKKEVLRENNNCLPKEVPSVKINLTESQAPENEIILQSELPVAGQRNESDLEDSEKNETIALLTTLLEEVEAHNLEVEKSPPLSVLERKDVAPIAYLSGDPPPIEEKVCEISSSNSIFLEPPLRKLSSTTVVIEDYNSESCVEINTAGNCPKITDDDLLDIKTDLVINAALNEDDLCLECISLTNDSGIISSPTSFCQISSETHDSDKIDLSTINIPALDEDPSKYPLTMAVREWLNQEAKEKTPEPIFRIPDDPKLSSIITSSLIEQIDRRSGDFDEWTSDESDIEDQTQVKPKNLLSNPSRVSSVNLMSNDNDSDYNSDSQQRFDDDDKTRERVASITSDIDRRVKGDLLDYWDDEFVRDPKKWLGCTNDDKESAFSTTPSEPLTPYESLYGKTIDYDRLLASNYEFLSNNIISFNGTSTAGDKHELMDESRLNNNNINNNDNFGTNINGNHNCLKPPEVCCMIM